MKAVRYKIYDSDIVNRMSGLVGQSFFASQSFFDLWLPLSGKAVIWAVEENDRLLAVMPAVEFGSKPLCRLQAMPDGCYGKIYSGSDVTDKKNKIVSMLLESVSNYGYLKTFIFDYHNSIPEAKTFNQKNYRTFIVNISALEWQPPDKKIQTEIRKAAREEVEIVTFDRSKHFDKFITLMKQTEQRHNRSPKYSDKFYNNLAKLAENDKRIVWLWCEKNNQPVTSHINFIENEMLINWQVFFDKSFSYLKANQFILYNLSREYAKKGLKYLNLGASPDEALSLIDYKSKWGGELVSYPAYEKKNWLGKLL